MASAFKILGYSLSRRFRGAHWIDMMWSRTAALGAGLYLLAFLSAAIYPWFDPRTFSGMAAVLLAWPWVDYFPSSALLFGVALNAVIIYAILAGLSRGFRR
jgi:hypothetical protein